MMRQIAVYTEAGSKRVFAGALDWPGWCRSAKDEAGALAELIAYGPRYVAVLGGTPDAGPGTELAALDHPGALEIVERLRGGSGTDFGVPSLPPLADQAELETREVERQVRILRACWAALDRVAVAAQGVTLRTGPRGGGRDLTKMLGHVLEAELAYILKLGSRPPKGDGSAAHAVAVREAAVAAFTARALGRPVPDPSQTKVLWSPRYYVRRAAWHVLDHAWEIEDRAQPE